MSSGSSPRLTKTRILHYFTLAKNACHYSDNHKAKLGSVIIYKNKVISVGWNLENKTNPLQKEYNRLRGYDPDASISRNTLHAEFAAMIKIKDIDIDFNKVNLFIYRIKKDGTAGLARPCQACMGFAKDLGIKHIYYTTESGWCYENINSK